MAPPYVRSYLLVLILDAEIGLLVRAPCLSRGTRKHHCRIPIYLIAISIGKIFMLFVYDYVYRLHLRSGEDNSFQSFYTESIFNKYHIYSCIPDHDLTKMSCERTQLAFFFNQQHST